MTVIQLPVVKLFDCVVGLDSIHNRHADVKEDNAEEVVMSRAHILSCLHSILCYEHIEVRIQNAHVRKKEEVFVIN